MIKQWTTHAQYRSYIMASVKSFDERQIKRLELFEGSLQKLALLNLDLLGEMLKQYYSVTGRPAVLQPEIFRSVVLMLDQGETSITNWVHTLKSDNLLCILIGFKPEHLPSLGAYYDFISRLWLYRESINDRKKLFTYNHKRTSTAKKPGKNNKLPNKHAGIVKKIVAFFRKGRSFRSRPERLMQEIFALLAVNPSAEAGLINSSQLTVSGDGTCIHCHSSSRGIKVCDCNTKGIYDCKCDRRFSDPEATHGWDSYLGHWFYGFTMYAMSCYNKALKIDLPLYWRFVGANRHDSVTGLVALAELRELSPNLKIRNLCFDSANDNYPTYHLCNDWNIRPFIDLNDKAGCKPKYPSLISVTKNGVPVCQAGHEMVFNGYCPGRSRLKWRCPLACGKISICSYKELCSPSAYGRVIYTKPAWDSRLFTPVPRGTSDFKDIYKQRTSSERVNNRFLHDYHLEDMRIRGKKRYSFMSMIIGINIHLDARIKALNLSAAN